MTTITELVSNIEDEVITNKEHQDRLNAELATAEKNDPRYVAMFRDLEHARAAQRRLNAKLDNARQIEKEEAETDRLSAQTFVNPALPEAHFTNRQRTSAVSVTRNESVYRQDQDPDGSAFLADVAQAAMGRGAAQERIARHQMEYREGATGVTGDFGDAIVQPQYLTDMAALAVSNKRHFANVHTMHAMPAEGMEFAIPTFTATDADEQAAELSAPATQQMTETDITTAVRTFAGSHLLSRQGIDRSRIQPFVIQDMNVRMAANLDKACLCETTYGALAVANNDDSEATTPEGLLAEIYDYAAAVEAATLGDAADVVVMDILTWNFLVKSTTDEHPLIGGMLSPGQLGNPNYSADIRGYLPNGLAVVVDANMPLDSSDHQILVAPRSELHLWQSAERFVQVEVVSKLQVEMAVYCYAAFEYRRVANALQLLQAVTLADGVEA